MSTGKEGMELKMVGGGWMVEVIFMRWDGIQGGEQDNIDEGNDHNYKEDNEIQLCTAFFLLIMLCGPFYQNLSFGLIQ